MLKTEIEYFLTYCKVSDFSGKSIETFTIRLNKGVEKSPAEV